MNRQQAPQPVVRPLPVLSTADDTRAFVLSKPASADGYHRGNFLLQSYRIDAGGVDIIPLIQIYMGNNRVSGYLEVCDDDSGKGHVVDGTNVTTQVLCDDLPCAVGTTNYEDALSYLREFIDELATDDYSVDEMLYDVRLYGPGARVDAIIDI